MNKLKIKIFADGAEKASIVELSKHPQISGFTTNPTLMRQAGISNYEAFCRDIINTVPDRPFSFEVFADDFDEMERQAMKIAEWGEHVYVKIPITNTKGESCGDLVEKLACRGLKLNVTALMTLQQVEAIVPRLEGTPSSYVSVFAGRIADTGIDPVPVMRDCVQALSVNPALELIWASPRELLNIFQADQIGCQVITVTHSVINKLGLVGKNLDEYSLETVKMFYSDGDKAGFSI
jgi:transaldolase